MKHLISVNYKGAIYEFPITSRLRSRFFSKFKKGRPDECWEWQGARRSTGGYGQLGFVISVNPKITFPVGAHRVSWEIRFGSAVGFNVLHTCDNPPCVNWNHLFLGDGLINANDAIDKGRAHDRRKITFAQAEEIRQVYVPYSRRFGCRALGRDYGLPFQSVSLIVRGISYKRSWNSPVTPI